MTLPPGPEHPICLLSSARKHRAAYETACVQAFISKAVAIALEVSLLHAFPGWIRKIDPSRSRISWRRNDSGFIAELMSPAATPNGTPQYQAIWLEELARLERTTQPAEVALHVHQDVMKVQLRRRIAIHRPGIVLLEGRKLSTDRIDGPTVAAARLNASFHHFHDFLVGKCAA